tara:strand:+ start:1716 stop:2435 length:720 start_codon:yes stop_codon:yes gene_type:complete
MIAVDIGNTNTSFGWFKSGKLIKEIKIPSPKLTPAIISKTIKKGTNEAVWLCSVVPSLTKLFSCLGKRVCIVGKDIKVPIHSLYDKKKVGSDRLVAAFAATRIYSRVRFVLDFGTAITLDFLSKKGSYQGGIILAGIGATQKALSACALLPKTTKILKKTKIIPRNTEESISKGIVEGFSLMVNGLIAKYRKKLKIRPNETIVITGGEGLAILKELNFAYKYEPQLVLKGLNILSRHTK